MATMLEARLLGTFEVKHKGIVKQYTCSSVDSTALLWCLSHASTETLINMFFFKKSIATSIVKPYSDAARHHVDWIRLRFSLSW